MTELAWISSAISAARPQAMGALLRYFRDLDTAEEAFQDACLRALKNWPQNGPPRDPAAWLIFVGRNSGIDAVRKRAKQAPMPEEDQISDLEDAESDIAERLDGAHYRDDILRLLFICCHPDLPATQQIAVALRIVSGLTVKQIARAFLVGESAMIEPLEERLSGYFHFFGLKGGLLMQLDRGEEARVAFDRAIALANTAAEAAHIRMYSS